MYGAEKAIFPGEPDLLDKNCDSLIHLLALVQKSTDLRSVFNEAKQI